MSDYDSKTALRKELFARVRAMSREARESASVSICRRISESPEYEAAEVVLTYAPLGTEPDVWAIFDSAQEAGKVTVFTAIENDRIVLYEASSRDQFVKGDFGILSPNPMECARFEDWERLDLILVPGVGFDQTEGARMGRGKGHYDRFLEIVRERNTEVSVVGVCYALQLEDVPVEAHDQPMNHIVSEAGTDLITWYLGLGANLGDREATMSACRDRLRAKNSSSLYETAPIDCEPGTPSFMNAVIEIESPLGPMQLLRLTQKMEVDFGRPADHGYHTPRSIDIDLLFAGECDFSIPNLTLPHPEIANRDFVLMPLQEVLAKGNGEADFFIKNRMAEGNGKSNQSVERRGRAW